MILLEDLAKRYPNAKRMSMDNTWCQETTGMIGDKYIRCLAPAVMHIQHRGRSEGPYFMCGFCGTHNADNRNAEVLAVKM